MSHPTWKTQPSVPPLSLTELDGTQGTRQSVSFILLRVSFLLKHTPSSCVVHNQQQHSVHPRPAHSQTFHIHPLSCPLSPSPPSSHSLRAGCPQILPRRCLLLQVRLSLFCPPPLSPSPFSPEPIPDRKRHFSIYALDHLEPSSAMHPIGPSSAHSQPGLAIGLGLMSWTLADPECDIAVTGTVVNDPVRGEAFETVFAFREVSLTALSYITLIPSDTLDSVRASAFLMRRTIPHDQSYRTAITENIASSQCEQSPKIAIFAILAVSHHCHFKSPRRLGVSRVI